MIVVTVEMWPAGDKTKAYPLGRTYIWNETEIEKHTKDPSRGDYGVAVMRKGCEEDLPQSGHTTRTGSVKNYPRLSYNVWRLVLRALRDAFYEERS